MNAALWAHTGTGNGGSFASAFFFFDFSSFLGGILAT